MNFRNWKHEILTIPNLLSLARLCLIPVYVTLYLRARTREEYLLSGAVLALSCLTDALDGCIARRFHCVSLLGKVLDPLADKATQLTLILCLCKKYSILKPVLVLLVVKEGFQAAACIVNYRRGKMLPGALPAGKVCTAVLFVSLTALVMLPDLNPRLVSVVAFADCVFLSISFAGYVLAYLGRNPRTRDVEL